MMSKVIVSAFSLILVVAVVIGVVAVVQHGKNQESAEGGTISSSTKNVAQICQPTDYKKACEKSLGNVTHDDPHEYIKAALLATSEAAKKAFNLSSDLLVKAEKSDNDTRMSLEDCKELLQDANDELQASFSEVGDKSQHNSKRRLAELQNWLSAVISYQQTCLDQFGDPNSKYKAEMKEGMVDVGELTSNALAMVNALAKVLSSVDLKLNLGSLTGSGGGGGGGSKNETNRKLLSVGLEEDGYPNWFSASRRRLMALDLTTIKPNVTVAADGSGDVKTVTDAIAKIPLKNTAPFFIYVKAGTYKEYPTIEKKKDNVFLYGDGPLKTIITGDHSNKTGYKTMRSATFAALGNSFTAKSIAFENSAGAAGHQAVALRVQADMAAFFDCKIDGYQDTLYTQAHRQFYSKCSISGTIDFIFGDASVIIQDSDIVVRKPMNNQLNTVTAHGRADKHETTGLVMQKCNIIAEELLKPDVATVKSYLGRPWRACSRTVVMESEITNVIQPEGWLPWNGDLYLDTLEYLEYSNTGAAAATDKRVTWKGFKVIDKAEAQKFTVEPFLQGTDWLNAIGEPFIAGLTK